jgi:nitronate monooxygenase
MAVMNDPRSRAAAFCDRFGLRLPILLAPMAGACPPSLSIAVMRAGCFGACGALLMHPNEIEKWAAEARANGDGPFQINLWIPDPPPVRDREYEARVREFLSGWGPPVPEDAGDMTPPNFEEQCQALLRIAPAAVSSIMGVYPPGFITELKSRRLSPLSCLLVTRCEKPPLLADTLHVMPIKNCVGMIAKASFEIIHFALVHLIETEFVNVV